MALPPDVMAEFEDSLDQLLKVFSELPEAGKKVKKRADLIRRQLGNGRHLCEVVAQEEQPLIVQTVREANAQMVEAFARFQRAEARALHVEGVSMEKIGALFGLSRQRVAALLQAPV